MTDKVSVFGFDFHFIVQQREINNCAASICDSLELSERWIYYKNYLTKMRISRDFFFFVKLAEGAFCLNWCRKKFV
jgi:hypothetical protein